MANYFAEVTDGKFGKVMAIDHDFSFGARSLTGQLEGRYSDRIGTHGKNILDENGKIKIPYMDNALADRIVALDEQVVRDIMADVLEPWAIDALCMRLQEMKDAITDDRNENPQSGRYLRNTADWGQQEVLAALRNDYVETGNDKQEPANYVSSMLMATETSNTKYVGQICDGPDLLKRVKESDLLTKLAARLYTKFIEDAKKKKASALSN